MTQRWEGVVPMSGYQKLYKMRMAGRGNAVEVTIPLLVIEREARKNGLTVTEFVKGFRAIAHFDSFEGIYYTFKEE